MRLEEFIRRYPEVLMNESGDQMFSSISLYCQGMSSPRTAKLLNFATTLMDENECYMEVGVFTGYTLCSAGHGNGKKVVGIDNLDMSQIGPIDKDYVRGRLRSNIQNLSITNAVIIEKDFRDVKLDDHVKEKAAVVYCDGLHTLKDVLEQMEWQEPFLAENAIIAFDDVNHYEVCEGIFEWLKKRPDHYELLFFSKQSQSGKGELPVIDRWVHNGFAIMRYSKNGFFKA